MRKFWKKNFPNWPKKSFNSPVTQKFTPKHFDEISTNLSKHFQTPKQTAYIGK